MKINLARLAAVAAAAVIASLFAGVAPAGAATSLGTVIGVPATGDTSTPLGARTSGVCPAASTIVRGFINGPGWVNVPAIQATDATPEMAASGLQVSDTLVGIAQSNGVTLVDGTYTLTVLCEDDLSVAQGQYDGTFTVTGASYAFAAPAAPASTTVLAVTPASPQNIGTPVTLTATVTSTATVAGTVQFKDGAANLGSPVAVSGGSAALTTSALTGGPHSLSAAFIPTTPTSIAGSTSNTVSYQINAPAAATTTTLSSSPASPTTADVVSLTATVTPANAVGSVTFKEGSTTVGTSAVSGGSASVSLTGLSAGPHSYTADFTPTNTANFLASTSAAYSITVTSFAGVSDSENITTTIPAGTLTITAGGPTVDLGTLQLNSSNTLLVQAAAKDINPVTVTDTRAGNLGWNVNGVVGDFVSGSGDKINSENLGWFPSIISQQPVQNVTKGPDVAPGAGVAVGATTGAGLKTPRLLASAAAGGSVGTAVLSAKLALQAPTSTKPGVYNTTLTLTAI